MGILTKARQVFTKAVTTVLSAVGLKDPRLYRMFGSASTHAGETVTVNTALQLDTVWACVLLQARTIATLPCQIFRSDSNGTGVITRDHPLYPILHDQPNADMTAVTFWQCVVGSLLLWGNAYAEISRAGDRPDGRIVALTPLLPDRLQRIPQADGSILYRYTSWAGQSWELTEDHIFHVKGFTLDGLVGISPIGQARESLGLALAAEKSAASIFRNEMRPSMAVSAPVYLTDDQRKRYKEDFIPAMTGAINAGRVPLLEGGWKIENLSMNPDDAQLLATRGFSVETICRWFSTPPVMVGHMEKQSAWGTGLEQMNLWFLIYTLRPLLLAIEQEIKRSLLSAVDRLNTYAEFNVEGLLRADSAGRAALLGVYADKGLRTRNELRALDNKEPLPGGDVLTVQMQMVPLEKIGQTPPPPPPAPIDNEGVKENVAA